MPDFKTIADFRKDNGEAIRRVCCEFVVQCRRLELFSEASVAIDGSKFKAVNTRDRNFTQAKMHAVWRRLTRALPVISRSSTAPIVKGKRYRKPRSPGSTRRLRRCARRFNA
jgi:hypothetical protein